MNTNEYNIQFDERKRVQHKSNSSFDQSLRKKSDLLSRSKSDDVITERAMVISRAEYQRLYQERKKAKSVYVKNQLASCQKRSDSSKRSKKKQKKSEEDR